MRFSSSPSSSDSVPGGQSVDAASLGRAPFSAHELSAHAPGGCGFLKKRYDVIPLLQKTAALGSLPDDEASLTAFAS
jgi:hypothetical protein